MNFYVVLGLVVSALRPVVLVGVWGSIWSAQAQSLSTDFQRAQQHDSTYAAALIENEAGKLQARIASMAYFPEARVSLSQLDNESSSRTTISISQPILSYDRWLGLKEADPRMAMAAVKMEQSQLELARRLFKVVAALVEARVKLALNVSSLQALETQAVAARSSYQLGMGTITDVRDTEVRLAQTKSQSFSLKASLSAAEREYVSVVGQAPLAGAYPLTKVVSPWRLPALAEFLERTEQRSLGVRAAELSVSLAEIAARRARAVLYPSVAAFAQGSQVGGNPASSNAGIALRMEIPLQAGTLFKGSAADLDLSKTQELVRNTILQVRLDVGRLYSQVEAGQSELGVRAEAIKAAELSLEANEQSFKGGVRTKVDVLNALQALFLTRSDYSSAQLRLGESLLGLLVVSSEDAGAILKQVQDRIFSE